MSDVNETFGYIKKALAIAIPTAIGGAIANIIFPSYGDKVAIGVLIIGAVVLIKNGWPVVSGIVLMVMFGGLGLLFVSPVIEKGMRKIPIIDRIASRKMAITAPAVPGKAAGKATVIAESANFRDKASTESNILQKVKKGDVLTVRGAEEGGWLPVKFNGKEGFISADLVTVSN